MTRQDVMNYLTNSSILELTELQVFIEERIKENSLSEYLRLEKELAEFKKRTKVKIPKVKGELIYRNPDNPDQVWTGNGKRPKWFADNESKGITKEMMKIEKD